MAMSQTIYYTHHFKGGHLNNIYRTKKEMLGVLMGEFCALVKTQQGVQFPLMWMLHMHAMYVSTSRGPSIHPFNVAKGTELYTRPVKITLLFVLDDLNLLINLTRTLIF